MRSIPHCARPDWFIGVLYATKPFQARTHCSIETSGLPLPFAPVILAKLKWSVDMNANKNSLGTFRSYRNRAIKATARDLARFGQASVWSDPDMRITELKRTHGFVLESVGGPRLDFVLGPSGIWRVH
jgi:hypothetical protein